MPGPSTKVVPPVRSLVRDAVAGAWREAVAAAALPAAPSDDDAVEVEIERPGDPTHGDFASNIALKLARPYRRAPLDIARAIAETLDGQRSAGDSGPANASVALLRSAVVAPPGFINLTLDDAFVAGRVAEILDAGERYGHVAASTPQRLNVEFVSANPTGPLHVGNARGAFIGDVLSRVLDAAGHGVTREYYFNDSGNQVRELGESVRRAHAGEPLDDAPYRGGYVAELGRDVPAEVDAQAAAAAARGEDPAWVYGRWATERMRAEIERSLADLGVRFDAWTTEGSLYGEGWVERGLAKLAAASATYESDGALWFRAAEYGDEKDRVLRKSDGSGTYFMADVGYLENKFARGSDHLIYVWGADHHGTVARLRGAATALGHDPASVEVLLYSWVRFVRDGKEVSMSKREGEYVTLDELLSEVGVDAARWYFASRSPTSPLDFDIELAKRQAPENPVYYVQYAHARIASILRVAAEQGLAPRADLVGLLRDDVELGLARALLRLPEVVEDSAARRETHEITAYAHELAATFHAFYRDRRVVDADAPDVSAARLALVAATRQVIANALGLLGISAPDSM